MGELSDFSHAIDKKIEHVAASNNSYLRKALTKVKRDMAKQVILYEESLCSFEDAYEDITHLFVFVEMYLAEDKTAPPYEGNRE